MHKVHTNKILIVCFSFKRKNKKRKNRKRKRRKRKMAGEIKQDFPHWHIIRSQYSVYTVQDSKHLDLRDIATWFKEKPERGRHTGPKVGGE